jgi:hypothetical protein
MTPQTTSGGRRLPRTSSSRFALWSVETAGLGTNTYCVQPSHEARVKPGVVGCWGSSEPSFMLVRLRGVSKGAHVSTSGNLNHRFCGALRE